LLVRSFANAVKEFAAKGDAMETGKLQKWDKVDVEKALEIGTGKCGGAPLTPPFPLSSITILFPRMSPIIEHF
jgi:hypothetical protein